MKQVYQELHYLFVEHPHLDAFPDETRQYQPLLDALPIEQCDAWERLRNNASLTAFEAGFRLGLSLGLDCPPAP